MARKDAQKAGVDDADETTTEEAAGGASRPDETVPGGHYIRSDGVHVDAEGRPLKVDKKGNLIGPDA